MFAKFNEMIENEDNSKTDLLENLKELARTISIYDQMKVAGELRENLDDIQGPLREEFYKVYAKYFVVRITEVRDNDDDFEGETFDFDEFVKSVVNLETNYNEPIEEDGKSRMAKAARSSRESILPSHYTPHLSWMSLFILLEQSFQVTWKWNIMTESIIVRSRRTMRTIQERYANSALPSKWSMINHYF